MQNWDIQLLIGVVIVPRDLIRIAGVILADVVILLRVAPLVVIKPWGVDGALVSTVVKEVLVVEAFVPKADGRFPVPD